MLDNRNNNDDEYIGRLKPLAVLITLVILVLIARVGYLQIYDGEYYARLADGNRIIVNARMTFRQAKPKDKDVLESYLLRRGSQPHGLHTHNAGCTFKNPEGNSAGKLLDECGCKNLSAGDAVVSDVHANFILNRGNATADDVIRLIEICAGRVYEKTGIKLEPEIKIFAPCSLM